MAGTLGNLPPTQSGTGFLSFNSMPPRLHITADDTEFDERTLQHWRDEGFDPTYLPYDRAEQKAYISKLKHLSDDLELGEAYGIICYGEAASVVLDVHIKPQPHLCCIVAYYPTFMKNPKTKYPANLQVLVHLAAGQGFAPSCPSHTYGGVQPGFAEYDLDEYNKVAADLAWSRTLGTVRKGFKREVDLVGPRENQVQLQYMRKDAKGIMGAFVADEPYVNYVPTMTGGIGARDLFRFYRDYFVPSNPASLNLKLISRTIGTDRIVDEMYVKFRHTQQMPWILPGVPPTGKEVEIAIVSIVKVRGGKLVHEHVYWDQASVLVQVGLLDPENVPKEMRSKGMEELPVNDREAARKVLDPESEPSNELLDGW